MGVQCSAGSVPPVFGRNSLFQQNNGVFQSNSSSANEIGIGNASGAGLVSNGLVGSASAFHLNSSVAPSPVHLHHHHHHHQLNANNSQTNGLSNGNSNNRETSNGKHSSLMRNGSLNHNNSNNSIGPVLLDYFPNAANDGLNVSWCHGVNSRARLNHALQSKLRRFG